MRTALITGGAGFLGSHLCDLFLQKGWKAICLDNLITGSRDNIAHHRGNKNFKFVHHNISLPIRFKEDIDIVLHFASPASPIDYLEHPIPTLKAGSLGTYHCLGLAKEKGARFLLASTSEIYGDPDEKHHPQREDYWGNVNVIGPRGVYDEAKRFAEAITMAYHRQHGLDTRIVRIFNTYGPRMRLKDGRAIPNFITQALANDPITIYGDGSQTRSFCYVSDLIAGIYKLAQQRSFSDPVNIGNPSEITLKELAVRIRRLAHSKSRLIFKPLPQDDPRQRRPDITRAKKLLKWRPTTDLDDGLRETIAWFKEHLK